MADLVVFGAGRIAEVAKTYIDAHGPHRIVGFTVDRAFKRSDVFQGLPLVAWEDLESHFRPGAVEILGPLSYRRLNELRRDRHREGRQRGYAFGSFIHPACHIYTAEIGENVFILEENIIQPFAKIGDGVMMWSGNHVGHHSAIGDYSFLSSQVGIGGGATIGERCFLGGKVGVEAGVSIGDRCFLDTATFVKKSIPADSVVSRKSDPIAPFSSSRLMRLI